MVFYGKFCEVCEMNKKEIKAKFWLLVSKKWLEGFSSKLVCRLPYLACTSIANVVPIG